MSVDTVLYLTLLLVIVGGFAITAFVAHLAEVDRKERQRKRAARHHPA